MLFDAIVLLLSKDGAEKLSGEAAARDFVADAFAHCKFLGYVAAATPLFDKAGVLLDDEDEGLILLDRAMRLTASSNPAATTTLRVTWRGPG